VSGERESSLADPHGGPAATDMSGELCSILKKNASVPSIAVAWFCDALVLTSSSSTSSTTPPFFKIPYERVS
jgi:hypothetical protein